MGSRLDELMEKVRTGLADLPEGTVRVALDHYREYIAEALEAGRTEEDILHRLGDPQEIVAQVRAEASIAKAERNPGPVRLSGAAREVVGRVASATGKASLVLGVSIPFSLAMSLYILAGAAFAGAVGAAALMAHGVKMIAPIYIGERIGTAGTGILGAAIFIAVGLGLWQAAKGITRLTLRILRRGLGRGQSMERDGYHSNGRIRTAFWVCAAASLLGVGMIVPSGLPLRYFTIWNSMKPENLVMRTESFRAVDIREIEATTLNSMIILKVAETSTGTIRFSYEEPDWLLGATAIEGGKLVFRETSKNRLPFLDFIARHEGMTALTIEVPRGFSAEALTLESKGGHVCVGIPARSIRIKTVDGSIRFDPGRVPYKIRATVLRGNIFIAGRPFVGDAYVSSVPAVRTAELESTGGRIEIGPAAP